MKVTFSHGKKAVMHIYNDDKEEEEAVELHTITTKEELHALMREKGFEQKQQQETNAGSQKSQMNLSAEESKRNEAHEQQRVLEKQKTIVLEASAMGAVPLVQLGKHYSLFLSGLSIAIVFGLYGRRRALTKRRSV